MDSETIEAGTKPGELLLYGEVGYAWDDEGFDAQTVVRALAQVGSGDITVRINSGGGDAFEGAAIHAVLKGHPGRVTIKVEGIAASAASLIAMAGDEIVMAEGAMMMIHDPSALTIGPAATHAKTAADLDKIAENYAAVYAARADISQAAARDLMLAETWMTAAEAVDLGFATSAMAQKAQPVAAFDYTVYASAPHALRALATESGWRKRQSKPRATAPVSMEVRMEPKEQAAEVAGAIAAQAAPSEPAAPAETRPESVTMRVSEEQAREIAEAKRRKAVVARFGDKLTAADADKVAASARDEAEALTMAADIVIAAKMADAGPEFRPTAHVVRDERDTRRSGMEQAIVAQLGRRAPETDQARPFMGMSLVEMAAAATDYRGSLRTVADRERVMMAASHTTSDFPAIFENALNKQLEARYREAMPTYRDISRRVTFNDFRPHPMVRTGDFPDLQEVGEGGEIQYGTFGEKREVVAVKSYGVAVRLSRQMIINDDLDGIAQVIADRGRAVARFEDKVFYAMMLGGSNADGPTLAETSRQVFNTTDKTKASSNAAITVASLAIGRAELRKRKSVDGNELDVSAAILLVGPDKETEAQQIVAPIQAQSAGNVNPFSGTLQVKTTAKITGNAWYLFASPADMPCFVHGFLSGFEAPRLRMDEPFGQQGVALSVEHDFGVGAIDFRGGFKNAGA